MILNQMCITSEITVGSWILYNNEKYEVLEVNEQFAIVESVEGRIHIPLSEIKDSVLKYTVKDGNRIYDLFPGSYKYAKHYKNKEIVNGFTQKFKTRASLGMTVRIDDLSTIDKFELYDKSERYAVLSDKKDNFFVLELTNTRAKRKGNITLHRNKFILVNEKDVKIFFKLIKKQ